MEKCMSAVIFAKCRAKMRMSHGRKASTAPSVLLAASLISLKILLLAVVANAFPAIHPSNACLGEKCWNRLSHDFKTDVAKITLATQEAADINVMLSVLYALLEGLSREMGMERTDIKGCLFYTSVDGCMIFSVVLYDTVAGGAGHVRRIVTADGQAFQRVLAKAISVVDNCDCNSSCYRCLRNYYNQKIHDNLNRNQASAFLHQWVGNMNPLPVKTIE